MLSDSLEGKSNQLTCITKFTVSFHVNGFSKPGVYKSQDWNQQGAWEKDSEARAQGFWLGSIWTAWLRSTGFMDIQL